MTDIVLNEGKTSELSPDIKVTGSAIYRQVSPENRKKIKRVAKKKAKEMGLIINIIEK